MQTVNFKCGHCGQVMAVGRENLGQQVRCPHCQQVVLAPGSEAPAAAAAPSPFGNLNEHEDIFIQKREAEDVLFGHAEGQAPRLELPRSPEPPPVISNNGQPMPEVAPVEPAPAPAPAPSTLTNPFVSEPAPLPTEQMPWSPPVSSAPTAAVQEQPPAIAPTRTPRAAKESFVSPMFLLLIFMPTLLWALGATGIAVWLYGKATERTGPQKSIFDELIDEGDNPGVKRKAQSRTMMITEDFATNPLPEHLKTTLGSPVTVGDLKVTPTGVFRRPVEVVAEGFERQPHECEYDSLVLELKLENVGSEYAFVPLDTYFDRKYKGIGHPPLTMVQAGGRTLYGGTHEWTPIVPSGGNRKPKARERLANRRKADSVALQPGDETTGYVCTDGRDEKTADFLFGSKEKKLKGYSGPMLWRVHVRRGPYDHRGKMISATAVIGVEFTDKDVIDEKGKRKDP